MSNAISIQHVSKTYRLGAIGAGTLQGDLGRWWARLRGKPDPLRPIADGSRQSGNVFQALQDVTFDVPRGAVLGIIGRNGAGKSTLLKILSQVTAPSSGRVEIRGRVASLLEVGTGFHPELTGRENIFLNGAILGMTKAEIRKNFDEIVAFSECEAFIDTPVKRYSSGMYVRLAFAVAAHLEAEILVVDEVLAVGDAQFRKKCLGKMRDVSTHGRTILFVSHSMAAISALCSKAVLLRDGRMAMHDDAIRVLTAYQMDRALSQAASYDLGTAARIGTGSGRFASMIVSATDGRGRSLRAAIPGSEITVETRLCCVADFRDANVAVMIFDPNGYRVIDANTAIHGEFLSLARGQSATVTFRLHDVLLKPGIYHVSLWLGRTAAESIDYIEQAGTLEIHDDTTAAQQPDTFPGVYQCRFSHHVDVVQDAGSDAGLQAARTARDRQPAIH
jgi:lipopolysaccharide transport system ATP-binding protein